MGWDEIMAHGTGAPQPVRDNVAKAHRTWRMSAYHCGDFRVTAEQKWTEDKIEKLDDRTLSVTGQLNGTLHCFLPRETVTLVLESGKVLSLHACLEIPQT